MSELDAAAVRQSSLNGTATSTATIALATATAPIASASQTTGMFAPKTSQQGASFELSTNPSQQRQLAELEREYGSEESFLYHMQKRLRDGEEL